jgi:hypothetical protein
MRGRAERSGAETRQEIDKGNSRMWPCTPQSPHHVNWPLETLISRYFAELRKGKLKVDIVSENR